MVRGELIIFKPLAAIGAKAAITADKFAARQGGYGLAHACASV